MKNILAYLKREFPEEERPYIFVDKHSKQRNEMLSIRSLIFPRRLFPDDETLLFMPICFVPNDEDIRNLRK